MMNLDKEIAKYVELRKHAWRPSTAYSVVSKLRTLGPNIGSPRAAYEDLSRRGYSRYTIKTYFITASDFERRIKGTKRFQEFLTENKTAFKNCYHDKTRTLKQEDYERLLAKYEQTHSVFNLLVLMAESGLRLSEALSVKWSDIQDGFLSVVGKGNKKRQIPVQLDRLKPNQLPTVVGELNLKQVRKELAPFTPHDFRAFFATLVANHPELNIKDAAMLLGHSSITTTSRYLRTDLNRVAKILGRDKRSDQQEVHRRD